MNRCVSAFSRSKGVFALINPDSWIHGELGIGVRQEVDDFGIFTEVKVVGGDLGDRYPEVGVLQNLGVVDGFGELRTVVVYIGHFDGQFADRLQRRMAAVLADQV